MFSIKNGVASKLTPDDIPDFYDRDSLLALREKLSMAGCKNLTNIDPSNCMCVFSAETIKDAEATFSLLPADSHGNVDDIIKLYPGKFFCINQDEIINLENKYRENISTLRNERKLVKKGWFNRFLIRMAIWLLALLVPLIVNCLLDGIIEKNYVAGAIATIFILGIAFLIGG